MDSRRTPWDDPAYAAASIASPSQPSIHISGPSPAAAPGDTTSAGVPSYLAMPAVPKSVARRRAEFEVEQAQEQYKKQLVSRWAILQLPFLKLMSHLYIRYLLLNLLAPRCELCIA